MLVGRGIVRVAHGPKENRFRPADPLFRSAASNYGRRVIGVVLTGALDDGTAGLWTIKQKGGTAIVQDPLDAEMPSMPQSALRAVETDYSVPHAEIANLLIKLVNDPLQRNNEGDDMEPDKKLEIEVSIAGGDAAFDRGIMEFGELTAFTCPDCRGTLLKFKEGVIERFRCHTGHAFSVDSLMLAMTEAVEDSMWNTLRAIEENILLLDHLEKHLRDANSQQSAICAEKRREAERQAQIIEWL